MSSVLLMWRRIKNMVVSMREGPDGEEEDKPSERQEGGDAGCTSHLALLSEYRKDKL